MFLISADNDQHHHKTISRSEAASSRLRPTRRSKTATIATTQSISMRTREASRHMVALIVLATTLALPQIAFALMHQQPVDYQQQAPSDTQLSPDFHEILVEPNSQVRMECKAPKSNILHHWMFQPTGQNKPQLLCFRQECTMSKHYGVELNSDEDLNVYDLIINKVTYELNDGSYLCDTQNPETHQKLIKEFKLTVLIPPQPPTIVTNSATAREGHEHMLSCISSGGNPEPNITWFRNELLIGPQPGLKIEQQRSNGTTTSTLSFMPTIEDHQAVYKCAVTNKAMNSMPAFEREHKLLVEYAPRISLGSINPLKVLLGASVTLPCLVDANPPVKGIRWLKDGRVISNSFNLTIMKTTIEDSSLFSCQADNGITPISMHSALSSAGSTSSFSSYLGSLLSGSSDSGRPITTVEAQIYLQILYGPRVNLKPSKMLPLNSGEYLTLNCSSDASPAPYEYIWTKAEEPNFRKVSSSSLFEFPAITASDAGNYTCTALNRLEPSDRAQVFDKQGSGGVSIQVRHSPGVAKIILGNNGETELGAKTLIHCRADPPGFPEPSYRFWRNDHDGKKTIIATKNHGPIYTILSAKPVDENRYGCEANNELGTSSEAEGDLIVNEPPRIIDDSNRRKSDAVQAGLTPYSLTVRAYGKPEPKVSWFHRSPVDGRRVELNSMEMISKFKIETITKQEINQNRKSAVVFSTLTFKQPLEIDDRGLYTVEFSNGLSKSAVEDFQLHIYHAPIPAPKNQPIISKAGSLALSNQRTKAGFDLNDIVNLTCRISAYPKPRCDWYSPNSKNPLDQDPRYSLSISNPRDDIWECSLSFSQLQESDYGDYLCAAANHDYPRDKFGESVQMIVSLMKKTIPDVPSQLEAIESSPDSITLQWNPGFDGGYPQPGYIVQYTADDNSGRSLSKRVQDQTGSGNLLDEQSSDVKFMDCESNNPCLIGQLMPRQNYLFRVRAKNEKGLSDYSEEFRASTRANMSQIPKILDVSFDSKNNHLHFRIEPDSDYLINNLNAKIEIKSYPTVQAKQHARGGEMLNGNNQLTELSQQPDAAASTVQEISVTSQSSQEWRQLPTVGPLRSEKVEAYMNMPQDIEQLRVTLCSRSNESLCGPEYVISMKMATSLFLQAERGLSISLLLSTIILIVVLGAFATTVHTCCISKKGKKGDSIDRIDGHSIDNKPPANGNGNHLNNKPSHGSTTSTNSTSANGHSSVSALNALQSIDSINNGLINSNGTGNASDHSSDHSRQAKLNSMIPPNYNDYADRATILMEQQHLYQQQQGLLNSDKLSSPFNNALLSVAGQQASPMMQTNGFAYGQSIYDQQPMSLDHHASLMDTNQLMPAIVGPDGQQWSAANQQQQQAMLDDYNNSYALNYQQQQQQEMIDPTYGTTAGLSQQLMSAQQSAVYDNTANISGQFQSYYQQQQDPYQQYQQEMANAQQQMYGTLTRQNNYSSNGNNSNNNNNDMMTTTSDDNTANQQLIDQQQYGAASASSMIQAPPPPPMHQQESDYGTTGGRNGRLIREIIV